MDEIEDGTARVYEIELSERRFRGLIARRGERLFGFVDRCPHAAVPLTRSATDDPIDNGLIQCCWHGARFEMESGYCVSGPCQGRSLSPWPIAVKGDRIVTA
ncbi:Rieske (2Fe-2S) protein [Flavisphingomonas formosensis]|uniref:Rieske (2Fe-2S) protein n=1 Tax=Flavisphingomonas formosensis TaxID=861534 RepID=UPI001E303DDD|nr:Rieske 2Fe-2S domain-containing protein [Sphingomonas formosensis]